MPTVSVILPTRDRPGLLPRAARSVLDQGCADLELIVVDDGSATAAATLLEGLGDARIRALRNERSVGPARARNLGIDAATGRWLGFIDDDDEWLPGKLERQLALAEASPPEVGAIYCPFAIQRHDGSRRPGARPVAAIRGELTEELLRGNFIGLPTLLVRRDCIDAVGSFDETLACFEDWELLLRLAARYRFDRVDETLVLAHDSPASVNKAASAVQAAAYRTILERHRVAIEARPVVHAEFLFHIGHHLCMSGEGAAGRRFHRRSVRTHRTLRGTLTLLASRLGGAFYRTLARGYDGLRR